MLPNKENAIKNILLDFGFFWPFFNQKTAKKNKINLAKSKPFDKIFINLVCKCLPTKENSTKNYLSIWPFLAFFGKKTQLKLTKNEENWHNPNR